MIAENGFCQRGHELTAENTYLYGNTKHCKECRRFRDKNSYNKQKGKSYEILTRGAERRLFCKYKHELTDENTYQTYKDGKKNGRKCRICSRNISKLYAKEDKNGSCYIGRMKHQMHKRYGINSLEERDKLLESQGFKCAICGSSDCVWDKGFKNVWHIDHKHDGTANHRGILCATCNHTIGRAKDDPALLRKMADYIESYQ